MPADELNRELKQHEIRGDKPIGRNDARGGRNHNRRDEVPHRRRKRCLGSNLSNATFLASKQK